MSWGVEVLGQELARIEAGQCSVHPSWNKRYMYQIYPIECTDFVCFKENFRASWCYEYKIRHIVNFFFQYFNVVGNFLLILLLCFQKVLLRSHKNILKNGKWYVQCLSSHNFIYSTSWGQPGRINPEKFNNKKLDPMEKTVYICIHNRLDFCSLFAYNFVQKISFAFYSSYLNYAWNIAFTETNSKQDCWGLKRNLFYFKAK